MLVDLQNLPSDPALLQRLVRDMAAAVESRDGEIERLQSIIKKLQRAQFGRSSERLDPDQLALALEELDADIARIQESRPFVSKPSAERPSRRKPLPDHLPREDVLVDVDNMICVLRWCAACHRRKRQRDAGLDSSAASRDQNDAAKICLPGLRDGDAGTSAGAGGLATRALLAQVLVSKYCDHTPLYRQSQIFARNGVELRRSTLAGWVSGACW